MTDKNILLVNKPPGPTSHDVVDEVRKITGEKRVGHAGTLDPFAEGLLIVLVGREATKRQAEFLKLNKEYEATLRLGGETDTGDLTGRFMIYDLGFKITLPRVKSALQKFIGEVEQVPPEYSAVKIKGRKAYELARRGEQIELSPRQIEIYDIKMLSYGYPLLRMKITCSSGTYIRALARDIGRELGCGAYVEKLIRTKIGKYRLKDCETLHELAKKHRR